MEMAGLLLSRISIEKDILKDEKYKYIFSVEEVNKLVLQGMPFRDAYKKVGMNIESGNFTYDINLQHTHEGSMGNLGTEEIKKQMTKITSSFPFTKVNKSIKELVG